jgi:hypothetical protein
MEICWWQIKACISNCLCPKILWQSCIQPQPSCLIIFAQLKRQFCFEINSGQPIKVTTHKTRKPSTYHTLITKKPKIHALTLSSIVNFQQIKPLTKNWEVFNYLSVECFDVWERDMNWLGLFSTERHHMN